MSHNRADLFNQPDGWYVASATCSFNTHRVVWILGGKVIGYATGKKKSLDNLAGYDLQAIRDACGGYLAVWSGKPAEDHQTPPGKGYKPGDFDFLGELTRLEPEPVCEWAEHFEVG